MEVDPHPSALGGHEDDKVGAVFRVELLDEVGALGPPGAPVEAAVVPAPHPAVVVQNVQDLGELGEDHGPVVLLEQGREEHVQDRQLPRRPR